jgi:hypothetical protein
VPYSANAASIRGRKRSKELVTETSRSKLSPALPEEIASLHAAASGGPVAAAASRLLFHEFENLDTTLAAAGAERELRW